jgi:hypothetical protein
MQFDPIVAEIRKIRELRAARFGFDIGAIVKDARQRDASGDREVVRLQPRRPLAPVQSGAKATAKLEPERG